MRTLGLWIILAAGFALAGFGGRPPAARPGDAPSHSFSAARAMAHVRAIGAVPHPIGSAAIEGVRGEVVARLSAAVGAPAQVHSGQGVFPPKWAPGALSAGAVQNVVAVSPGRDPTAPALLIMAHDDSVPNSPGAADDAAGVAALIEIARSLCADARAGRPHARDVIFLATDGEEAGLLGAQAFFAGDALAPRVGAVINLEARGDAGRAAMFQTGPDDGAMLRLYGATAERPFANSLTGFVASVLPNDTDFTLARQRHLPGLNFAFIDDQLAYHTPLATPEHLDPRSLQNLGGQALPAARALADAPALPGPAPDLAYGDLFGRAFLAYPADVGGWILLGAIALLAGFALWRARRLELAPWRDVARGVGVTLSATLVAALALRAAGAALGGAQGDLRLYALLVRDRLLFAGCALLTLGAVLAVFALSARGVTRRWVRALLAVGMVALGAAGGAGGGLDPLALGVGAGLGVATGVLAFVILGKPVTAWGAWLGALLTGLLLTLALQIAAPPTAIVTAWPLALGALAAALVFGAGAGERAGRAALALAGALAVVAVGLAAGWAAGVFAALGPTTPGALAIFALLALPALAPFLRWRASGRFSGVEAGGLALAGVAALAFVGLSDGTAARPRPTTAFYLADPQDGHAWRVAPVSRLDAWTRAVLTRDGATPQLTAVDGEGAPRVWATPAALTDATGPAITVTHDAAASGAGRLIVTVRPSTPARSLELRLRADTPLGDPRLNARPVAWPESRGGWRSLRFDAPPPEGVTLSFATAPHGKAEIRVQEIADGWPRGLKAPPPKPPGLMAWRSADTTRLRTHTESGW